MIILDAHRKEGSDAGAHVMAYVMAPDRDTARGIARAVLSQRLAACANLAPIESLYWWKGQIEESPEGLLIFKTRRELVGRLTAAVKAIHPCEIPCVVTYPMEEGFRPYLAWLDGETGGQR